jgi:gamma-glutamyltranspeptidase / glutathione hydrolase
MHSRLAGAAAAVLLALVTQSARASAPFGEAPSARSKRGMVSAATPESVEAGARALAAGGGAVDAAISAAFALAVTYPQAGNLAGGGFAVVRTPEGGFFALDFRETAPAGTWRNTYLDAQGASRPQASRFGGLAVATPGTVRGLEALHRKFGRLPWRRLVAPAIALARDGYRTPPGLARELAEDSVRRVLSRDAEAARLFYPHGKPVAQGTLLVQPDLAATLEAIASRGADGFHRGEIARRIAEFVRATGGVLTEADLAGYAPSWRIPFAFDDGRFRLVTMPSPSSGGFLLASILGQLRFARGDISSRDAAETIHLIAEAERRAYADRNRFLGDADCVDEPLARLLAPARLAALGFSIDPSRVTPSREVTGGAWPGEHDQTTHLSTATVDGDAVALTYTLNDAFGNGTIVPRVGVLLNNEMDDFSAVPGVANAYGLVQGEANAVRAGGRPLSSMVPTIVLEDGRPRFVLGSPGGATIPTTVLQVFLNAGPRGEPLAEAVAAPRFHHQHLPDRIEVETGAYPESVKAALRAKGHVVSERGMLGRIHAIAFEKDGTLTGVADPRGYGAAAGPEGAESASASRSLRARNRRSGAVETSFSALR